MLPCSGAVTEPISRHAGRDAPNRMSASAWRRAMVRLRLSVAFYLLGSGKESREYFSIRIVSHATCFTFDGFRDRKYSQSVC